MALWHCDIRPPVIHAVIWFGQRRHARQAPDNTNDIKVIGVRDLPTHVVTYLSHRWLPTACYRHKPRKAMGHQGGVWRLRAWQHLTFQPTKRRYEAWDLPDHSRCQSVIGTPHFDLRELFLEAYLIMGLFSFLYHLLFITFFFSFLSFFFMGAFNFIWSNGMYNRLNIPNTHASHSVSVICRILSNFYFHSFIIIF